MSELNEKQRRNMTKKQINEYNISRDILHTEGRIFICTNCKRFVSLDGSCSNQFKDLICRHCLTTLSNKHDMSEGEYLRKFIWK